MKSLKNVELLNISPANCGVLKDGVEISSLREIRNGIPVNKLNVFKSEKKLITKRYVEKAYFCGYLYHYGHFLLESLSRLHEINFNSELPLLFFSPTKTLEKFEIENIILDVESLL